MRNFVHFQNLTINFFSSEKKKRIKMTEQMSRKEFQLKMAENLLKNTRNLGALINKIAEEAMKKTDIIQADEVNCRKLDYIKICNIYATELMSVGTSREEITRIIDQLSQGQQINSSEVDLGTLEIIKGKIKGVRTLRLQEALDQLKMFTRVSYMFDDEGYHWSKYYERETDEPEKEAFCRGLVNEEIRQKYRRSGLVLFLSGIYTYLQAIKEKDISFLVDNLDKIIKNEEFTSRIAIVFGSKDEHGNLTTSYATPDQIEKVWKSIYACIKNAINFCHAKGLTELRVKTIKDGQIVERTARLNYEKLAEDWGIAEYHNYTD